MEKKIESVMELVCDNCRYPHLAEDQEACIERCENCPVEARIRSMMKQMVVRQGLARQAEQRREAALEAAERDFRAECNARVYSHRAQMEAAKEAQRRETERLAAEAARKAEAARRRKEMAHQEAQECAAAYRFMFRLFAPLLMAAIVLALSYSDVLPFWLAAAFAIFACAVSIDTYIEQYFPSLKATTKRKKSTGM